MQIHSTVRAQQASRPAPANSPQEKSETGSADTVELSGDKKSAKEWADWVKARSTLTGLIEPLGITVGFLQTPAESLHMFGQTGSALVHGDFGKMSHGFDQIADKAYHPNGVGGAIYRSAQGVEAVTGGAVGALEVYAGMESKDKFLMMMGGADLVGALGSASRAASMDGVALGLGVASTVGRTALVAANLDKFSRTQKVKTFLDAGGSVASSMVKSGFLVTPAIAVMSVCGLGQLAYMNVPSVRGKADKMLDRVFGPEKKPSDVSTTPEGPQE